MCVDQFEVFRCSETPRIGPRTSRFSFGFSGGNSEQTVKHPKDVFSRKHSAHCLNAVPGYWCKMAEHCKQILLQCNRELLTPHGKRPTLLERFNRSLTRADENGSSDIDISLGYRRRGRVSSNLRSYKSDIPKYNR